MPFIWQSAKYSDKFAYRSVSIIGESFDFGTLKNKELRMPPVKELQAKYVEY